MSNSRALMKEMKLRDNKSVYAWSNPIYILGKLW